MAPRPSIPNTIRVRDPDDLPDAVTGFFVLPADWANSFVFNPTLGCFCGDPVGGVDGGMEIAPVFADPPTGFKRSPNKSVALR